MADSHSTPNPVLAHSAKPSRFAFSVNAGPVPFERLASEREFIFRMLESDADGLVDSDTAMCALAEIETSMTVVPVLGTSDAAKRLSVALETMSRFESLEDDSLEAKLIGSVINWLQGGLS
jgi:hypothetical protein